METVYKGFRFRSRLEARWGMFFDRVGIKWDFEPQPLLINGEPYLPDFVVQAGPTGSFYHEVKAPDEVGRIKPIRVYLAGKIDPYKSDWRGTVMSREENAPWDEQFAVLDSASFICTGPFLTSWGHGDVTDSKDEPHWSTTREPWILQNCLAGIGAADIVCAHISEPDAFGTIAEIGYAYAGMKKISLTIASEVVENMPKKYDRRGKPGRHDLWFVEEMAATHAVVNNVVAAREFHADVISSAQTREYRLIAGIGRTRAAVMTFGDPLRVATDGGEISFLGAHLVGICRQNIDAAREVRAHRFDRHG